MGYEWLDEWFAAVGRDNDVDHVLMCGDAIGTSEDPSRTNDFETLRTLLKKHGWNDGHRTSLVPGNHDVRWMGCFTCADELRAVHQHFPKLFQGPLLKGRDRYPLVKRFGDVHLIGLDTVSDMQWSLHSGMLGEEQLDELARLLRDPSIARGHVIVAMHHPPFSTYGRFKDIVEGQLHDADKFWKIVNSSPVDLVVCGHEHDSWEYKRRSVPVVCVGGFMENDSNSLIVDVGEGALKYFWWNAWRPATFSAAVRDLKPQRR
jgi:3',5'-cyclic AMP phosphodiesterase CpdA